MLFGDIELAARIERAACALHGDCADVIADRRGTRVLNRPVAGGVAVHTGEGSPLNKVAGLGFGGALNEAEWTEIEEEFATRNSPVRVELSSLADPAIAAQLTRRGYVLAGFENVLGLGLPAQCTQPIGPDIAVRVCDDADFEQWLDVTVAGFATPDTQGIRSGESFPRGVLEQVMHDMTAAAGFVRYLAYRGTGPAGGASMRVSDGIAQLCGAATLPEHRRRGVQTALSVTRMHDAVRHGCDIAVVTTQPGSKSQQNAQRQGFQLLYTRAVLERDRKS